MVAIPRTERNATGLFRSTTDYLVDSAVQNARLATDVWLAPLAPFLRYHEPAVTSAERVMEEAIFPGCNIWYQTGWAAPRGLTPALAAHIANHPELQGNVSITCMRTEDPYIKDFVAAGGRLNALFIGPDSREDIRSHRGDFTPTDFKRIPTHIARGELPIDIAFITISRNNTLGISVETTRAVLESVKQNPNGIIVAVRNMYMPDTVGDTHVNLNDVDYIVEDNRPLVAENGAPLSADVLKMGEIISMLIPDGATLQPGIGDIPNAVFEFLKDKKDLGIHAEMVGGGLLKVVKIPGVMTGKYKRYDRDKFPELIHQDSMVVSFVGGSQELYDFIKENPYSIEFHRTERVNDPNIIRGLHSMCSLNSALQVDFSGQVCADSIGTSMYSGAGGQADFVDGATGNVDGISIIAMPSYFIDKKTGQVMSKIVPMLTEGAGVVTTRNAVDWIVTENGAVRLAAQTLRHRTAMLIRIAYPDRKLKEELIEQAVKIGWLSSVDDYHEALKEIEQSDRLWTPARRAQYRYQQQSIVTLDGSPYEDPAFS